MKKEKIFIPVKSYKKGPVILVAKRVKDITDLSLKLAKVFQNGLAVSIKTNVLLYSNVSQCSRAIKVCKKFASRINR